jgi:hypothetical protein
LREHGIEVEIGEGAEAAATLIEAHATRMRLGRPFITLALEVPDTCIEEIGSDADALLVRGPLPRTWSGAAYTLDSGPAEVTARLVRPGDRSLPQRLVAAGLSGLLSAFAGSAVSSLLADATLGEGLLRERLVDRLAVGPHSVVPDGFALRSGDQLSSGCRMYYPESP